MSLLEAALRRRNDDVALQLIGGGAQLGPRELVQLVTRPSGQSARLLKEALDRDLVDKTEPDWAHRALETLLRTLTQSEDEHDRFGPLHRAARGGALESVRLLLNAGALPNARSYNGRTALYEVTFAADDMTSPEKEERVLAVIEALLKAGADPLNVDDVGRVTFEQLKHQSWTREGSLTLRELLVQHMNPDWL